MNDGGMKLFQRDKSEHLRAPMADWNVCAILANSFAFIPFREAEIQNAFAGSRVRWRRRCEC